MYINYREGLGIINESIMSNFSSLNSIKIKFEPEDLFLEIATDVDSLDYESYLIKFLNSFKKSKSEVLNLIKDAIPKWESRSIKFMDELYIQKGAKIVKNILLKYKLI